jgi:hypothetical protein
VVPYRRYQRPGAHVARSHRSDACGYEKPTAATRPPDAFEPLHLPVLAFVLLTGVKPEPLTHFNSFPCDQVPSASDWLVIYRIHPRLGAAAFAWAVIMNFAWAYEGYHFQQDGLGSIGLGVLVVSLFEIRRCWQMAFLPIYQIATLFNGLCQIGRVFPASCCIMNRSASLDSPQVGDRPAIGTPLLHRGARLSEECLPQPVVSG